MCAEESNDKASEQDTLEPETSHQRDRAEERLDPAELDIDISDPSGPPQNVSSNKTRLNLGAAAAVVAVAGGATIYFIGGQVTSCHGATRSATLQWQQRQAEIQRALEQEEAYQRAATEARDDSTNEPANENEESGDAE